MLILTRADVQRVLAIAPVIEAVEAAHAAICQGQASQIVESPLPLLSDSAVMLPMAAALGAGPANGHGNAAAAIAGVKVMTDAPANRRRSLPAQNSTITLIDPSNGICLALIDGVEITRYRTAAASAVATRHLARDSVDTLGIVGAGALARTHLMAMLAVRDFARVLVWSRSRETAQRFVDESSAIHTLPITCVASPEAVVRGSDVVCTLTPSRDPLIRGEWFEPGLHINAVGAPPRPDHREIDTEGLLRSTVVVDDLGAATTRSGEICIPIAEGAFRADDIDAELGEVVLHKRPGRRRADQITLFNSVGLAIQDMAAARHVLAQASIEGIGTEVDLATPLDRLSYTTRR